MLEDEKKIIRGAKAGNTADFDQLYLHYLPAIYRFIYMKVTDKQEAEDLTHEVFLSAWQNVWRYRSRGFPFGSWLYQIARNRVIDYYRVKKNHSPIESIEESAELAETGSSIEDRLDDGLIFSKIKLALQKLSPDEQDIILMRFMEELSHREIASAMNKSEGSVRVMQHRAIAELKKLLTEIKFKEENLS